MVLGFQKLLFSMDTVPSTAKSGSYSPGKNWNTELALATKSALGISTRVSVVAKWCGRKPRRGVLRLFLFNF